MTTHVNTQLNEDTAPIPDHLFNQLRQASATEAMEITKVLPEPQRARLAAFCYNKSHLHALALVTASSCDRNSLIKAGGCSGEMIFKQSRDPKHVPSGSRRTNPISLAGPSLSVAGLSPMITN